MSDTSFFDAIEHQERMCVAARQMEAANELCRPSYLYRPALSLDGNKWCALYGVNLHDGVAGFGNSPAEAYADFDVQWTTKLPPRVSP